MSSRKYWVDLFKYQITPTNTDQEANQQESQGAQESQEILHKPFASAGVFEFVSLGLFLKRSLSLLKPLSSTVESSPPSLRSGCFVPLSSPTWIALSTTAQYTMSVNTTTTKKWRLMLDLGAP
ncbi:hypothetical protein PC121_g23061 [Phytophthora cactorum]|nr:hypothetical protein PC120_g18372 [Phytophthora cactorum]KAG3042632.1 hypothetical protein PC121_g23061 [Phytophthora cactorum]